jgi:hypothetical protein
VDFVVGGQTCLPRIFDLKRYGDFGQNQKASSFFDEAFATIGVIESAPLSAAGMVRYR